MRVDNLLWVGAMFQSGACGEAREVAEIKHNNLWRASSLSLWEMSAAMASVLEVAKRVNPVFHL